jgi:cyanophycin synthetase
MEITKICALRGPNLWTRHTAIEATVACTENERSLTAMPQVEARLRARFPEIGFLEPATHAEAMSLAHVLELATLGLQAQAGCPITFSRTAPTHRPGVFLVAVEYTEEAVGRLALELAEALCRAAVADAPFDINAALARLHELDEDLRLGPSTGAIVQAATVRGVPYCRLTSGSLVQFGWGSRQRRIQAAETDRSSAIAESVAQDKELTKKLLAAAGVPVPTGRSVMDAEDAWRTACEIGGPVVVKPRDGNQGKGVAVGVEGRAAVMAAYEVAAAVRDDVIVERSLSGNDFRLLVVGRSLVAATS